VDLAHLEKHRIIINSLLCSQVISYYFGGHMGCHASIRGVLTMDLIPEFLWKHMDLPLDDKTPLIDTNQKRKRE
jgi:hypothetical protein